ncbi:glycine--tRNA ligase subunit beta [Lagierella sp.]|uniref:glycine--tRNA ligase subunit beta n=1 Tax=Lagierella sp. TaxID=2849657 RepID=UPI00262446C4|nr:glycine--tRNA ligase subunit beta [Lagierella sp.]
MKREILIELGIEGLPYNLYDVAVNSLFESVRRRLKDYKIQFKDLKINYSKNRILINFYFLDSEYNKGDIVNFVKNTIEKVFIPIRGLKRSNRLGDYILWVQGVIDQQSLDFSNLEFHRDTKVPFYKMKDTKSYREELSDNNIIFENKKRKEYFLQKSNKLAKEHGGEIHHVDYLIEKFIAEFNLPHPIVGDFNKELLEFPKELVISILIDICNVVPLFTDRGQLMPYYIYCIEKVQKEDEEFQKNKLKTINDKLSEILSEWKLVLNRDYEIYSERMKETKLPERVGTLFDKSKRLMDLSVIIGDYLLVGDETKDNVKEAAEISKFDLTTKIVIDYPQLKGVIGFLYSKNKGNNDIISTAIKSHYKPKYFHDTMPSTTTGKILSLADKLDEITNWFIYSKLNDSTSEYQTSEIRRYASGIIKLIIQNKWSLNISTLIDDNLYLYIKNGNMVLDTPELKTEIYNFIISKFREDVVKNYNDYCKLDMLLGKNPNNILETYEKLSEGDTDERE